MYVLNICTYLIEIECDCDEGPMYMMKKLIVLLFYENQRSKYYEKHI